MDPMDIDTGINFDPIANQVEVGMTGPFGHPYPALRGHTTFPGYNSNSPWHGNDPLLSTISVGSLDRYGALRAALGKFETDPKYRTANYEYLYKKVHTVSYMPDADDIRLHPVFKRRNCFRMTDLEYELLKPSFRLATDILGCWEVLGFFLGLSRATPFLATAAEQKRFGKEELYRFSPVTIMSEAQAEEAKALLDAMSDCVQWEFNMEMTTGLEVFMLTCITNGFSGCHQHGKASRIAISPDFRNALAGMVPVTDISPDFDQASSMLRVRLFTAYVLVHEICHAFNMAWRAEEHNIEPFMNDGRVAELGHAFETHVFGGTLQISGCNPTHFGIPFGFHFLEHPDSALHLERQMLRKGLGKAGINKHSYYALHMDYVCKVLSTGFWDEHVERFGVDNCLRLPKELGVRYKLKHQIWWDESPTAMEFELGLTSLHLRPEVEEGVIWLDGSYGLGPHGQKYKPFLQSRANSIKVFEILERVRLPWTRPPNPGEDAGGECPDDVDEDDTDDIS